MNAALIYATHNHLPFIYSVMNSPENLDKLEYYDEASLLNAFLSFDDYFKVCVLNNQPAGYFWARLGKNKDVKIEEFAIANKGEGLGSKFFEIALDALKNKGLNKIWLYVAADNIGAINFYSKFGFTQGETLKNRWKRRKGAIADALKMELTAIKK